MVKILHISVDNLAKRILLNLKFMNRSPTNDTVISYLSSSSSSSMKSSIFSFKSVSKI